MKRTDTETRILEAARKILDDEGAAAVSMRRVADAIGVTAMAIYRHFPNREALLHRLADDTFAEVAERWIKTAKSPDVEKRLMQLQDGYLDYALEHPHAFDYAYSVRRDDARRFPEDFRARRSPTLNLVADTLAEGMRSGLFREDDVWDVAMSIWAHIHGLICLYRAGRFSYSEKSFRAFYRASLRRQFDGLKT